MPDAHDPRFADQALPRYASRPLPLQRYLPGRTPRPRAVEAPPPGTASRIDPAAWRSSEDFLHGVDLWNRRFFWEAHEAWEEPWRRVGRATPAGRFLQGLILLAAGALKHELGARAPARRIAARGARRLRESAVVSPGFDALAFAAAVEAWLGGVEPGPPVISL